MFQESDGRLAQLVTFLRVIKLEKRCANGEGAATKRSHPQRWKGKGTILYVRLNKKTLYPGFFLRVLQSVMDMTGGIFYAMQEDSYSTSHPLTNPVESPSEIGRQFSTITYTKVGFERTLQLAGP